MKKKELQREKLAWNVAFVGGILGCISLVLLFIVILQYNETLLVIAYNLAFVVLLVAFVALALMVRAIGFKASQEDGGMRVLRYRSGKLAAAIIVGMFVVIAFSRAEVYNQEIETGVRSADGTVQESDR